MINSQDCNIISSFFDKLAKKHGIDKDYIDITCVDNTIRAYYLESNNKYKLLEEITFDSNE